MEVLDVIDIRREKPLEVIDIRRELPVVEEVEDDNITPFLVGAISVAVPMLMTAIWIICGH